MTLNPLSFTNNIANATKLTLDKEACQFYYKHYKMSTEKRKGRPARFDREMVLDKATALFAQHGYYGTSLNELVRAIGCTPPSLYNYFPSKADLYLAVVERYWAWASPEFPVRGRAWTHLEDYLMAALVSYTDGHGPKGCLVLTGSFRESVQDQVLKDALHKLRQDALENFTNLVVRIQEEGDLPSELDAHAWSRGLFALLQGLALQSMDGATLDELKAGLVGFLSGSRSSLKPVLLEQHPHT
jgi:TetR/AcrR family transcriptional regulator, copper-responsive repressor